MEKEREINIDFEPSSREEAREKFSQSHKHVMELEQNLEGMIRSIDPASGRESQDDIFEEIKGLKLQLEEARAESLKDLDNWLELIKQDFNK